MKRKMVAFTALFMNHSFGIINIQGNVSKIFRTIDPLSHMLRFKTPGLDQQYILPIQ